MLKIITTHIGADFDSLASMVAAAKLYPGAKACFSGAAGRNVREFLKRMPGRWEILTPSQIDINKITMLIVDARFPPHRFLCWHPRPSWTGGPRYDHHAAVQEEIEASFSLIEPVGPQPPSS